MGENVLWESVLVVVAGVGSFMLGVELGLVAVFVIRGCVGCLVSACACASLLKLVVVRSSIPKLALGSWSFVVVGQCCFVVI